jgi:predicted site-specific integrase-resolvase
MFLCADDIDARLNWERGTARRLARRGVLPHVVLPDGAIRFRWEEISRLLRYVPTAQQNAEAASVR